jgi:hypothetical protein
MSLAQDSPARSSSVMQALAGPRPEVLLEAPEGAGTADVVVSALGFHDASCRQVRRLQGMPTA